MGANKDKIFEENLSQLERDGFLLIKNVLDMEDCSKMAGQSVWALQTRRI